MNRSSSRTTQGKENLQCHSWLQLITDSRKESGVFRVQRPSHQVPPQPRITPLPCLSTSPGYCWETPWPVFASASARHLGRAETHSFSCRWCPAEPVVHCGWSRSNPPFLHFGGSCGSSNYCFLRISEVVQAVPNHHVMLGKLPEASPLCFRHRGNSWNPSVSKLLL